MPPRTWTADEIRAFTSGTIVHLRDENIGTQAVPDWLLGPGAAPATASVGERLAHIHADDLTAVTQASTDAWANPGEVVECRYRTRIGDAWFRERSRVLNLLHQPEVNGVVLVTEVIEALDGTDEPETDAWLGSYTRAKWVFQQLDAQSNVIEIEGMAEEIFGAPADEILGTSLARFLSHHDLMEALPMWSELLAQPGTTFSAIQHLQRPDGSSLWIESLLVHRASEDGRTEIVNVIHDITERREQELALQQRDAEFRLVADEVPAGVFRCDVDGGVTFHNERWTELAPGVDIENLRDLVDPADRAALDEAMQQAVEGADGAGSVRLEVRGRAAGQSLALRLRAVVIPGSGRMSIVGSIDDITDRVSLHERANHDPLTGLLNRRGLEDHLADRLRDDPAGTLVVFLDLDGFKTVNDTFGHDIGDRVLCEVAARLASLLRSGDAVGRYGGDEFVVVCQGVDHGGEGVIADRLVAAFDEPVCWDGGSWDAAGSIGYARARADDDLSSVLRCADHAMLEVKRNRRADRR